MFDYIILMLSRDGDAEERREIDDKVSCCCVVVGRKRSRKKRRSGGRALKGNNNNDDGNNIKDTNRARAIGIKKYVRKISSFVFIYLRCVGVCY